MPFLPPAPVFHHFVKSSAVASLKRVRKKGHGTGAKSVIQRNSDTKCCRNGKTSAQRNVNTYPVYRCFTEAKLKANNTLYQRREKTHRDRKSECTLGWCTLFLYCHYIRTFRRHTQCESTINAI